MADSLKDFFLSIGFVVDEASRKKVEQAVVRNENRLTATTVAELERRRAAEEKMLTQRVNAIVSVGGELETEEKAHASRLLKIHQDQADKSRSIEVAEAKKSAQRRAAAFKAMQMFAVQAAAVATKAVVALEGTALGITYAVDRTAKKFESLNYSAQRSASSVRGITAFSYAASQLGASVDDAGGSISRFGDNIKRLPGYAAMLSRMGVQTRGADGRMRDSTDIATDFGDRLRRMRDSDPRLGYARALNYADALGIDENTARALMDPRFRQFEQQRRSEQGALGFDPNRAGVEGTAFEQSMRKLQAVIEDLTDRIRSSLFKQIGPILEDLAGWLQSHGKRIADVVGSIADSIVQLATAFAKSDVLKGAVEGVASGMQALASFVGSDDFKKDLKAFAEGMGKLARVVYKVLEYFNLVPGAKAAEAGGSEAQSAGRARLDDMFERGRNGVPETTLQRAAGLARRWLGRDNMAFDPNVVGSGKWKDAGVSKGEVADYIRQSAARNGNDPDTALRVSKSEGFDTYTGDYGTSFGPFQLHYGGSGIPGMNSRGMGDDFTRDTGLDARDPRTWKAQIDYAMKRARREGWSAWHGAARVGIGSREGIGTYYGPVPDAKYAKPKIDFAPAATNSFQPMGSGPKLPSRAMYWATDSKGNRVAVDAQGRAVTSSGAPTTVRPSPLVTLPSLNRPLGETGSVMYDNSRSRGDTNITHNSTYNITGSGNPLNALNAARLNSSRGQVDLLRNIQGAEQ